MLVVAAYLGNRNSQEDDWAKRKVNALLLFVVVVILPNGQPQVDAGVVDKCPDTQAIIQIYEQAVIRGDILDWRARCYNSDLLRPSST